MSREQRMKYCGTIFYLFLIAFFFTSNQNIITQEIFKNRDIFEKLIIPFLGIGIALFTSESIGFIFNGIFIFFWNLNIMKPRHWLKPEESGYGNEWKKLKYEFKYEVLRHYKEQTKEEFKGTPRNAKKKSWEDYGSDVFFSYFWQQGPKDLIGWVSRRHSAFFLYMSETVAILASCSTWFTITMFSDKLQWTCNNWIVFSIALVFCIMFFYNALGARREAWQVIDIWISNGFDRRLYKSTKKILDLFKN